MDLVASLFGILEIDGVDLEKRKIALPVLGAADFTLDRVAGPQAEPSDLARAYIDIVRPGEIICIG